MDAGNANRRNMFKISSKSIDSHNVSPHCNAMCTRQTTMFVFLALVAFFATADVESQNVDELALPGVAQDAVAPPSAKVSAHVASGAHGP